MPIAGRRPRQGVAVAAAARERFEAASAPRPTALRADDRQRSEYVADEAAGVEQALRRASRPGPDGPRTSCSRRAALSTDPRDPFFVAVEALGGRLVRRGVPAHPGSMLWLARIGRAAVRRPADLRRLLEGHRRGPAPARLAAGQPATPATVARLGHGGILTRSQRFRFPAYARDLDAPDG